MSRFWLGQFIHPVGECCGRRFFTWEGWHEHQLSHRSEYNLADPLTQRCSHPAKGVES